MKRLIFAALSLATVLIPQTALSEVVAQIGATEYTTIEDAFSKAADGETITLVSNTSISSTISVSKNITLDLQEHTISNSCTKTNIITVSSAGTLTIRGSGAIVNTGSTACNLINVLGTFKLESGTLRSNATNVGVVRIYNGNFNMTGGCIENVCSGDGSGPFDTKYTAIHIQYTKSNTTEYSTDITGGKISSNKTAIYNANYCTKTKVKIGDGVEITGYLCDNNGIGYYTSVPTYCILYSKAETVGEKENVIYDVLNSPTCTKLALSDNYKFYSPKSFAAKASSYTRDMTNTWGTLCVPFAIDIESSNVECYSITGVSGTELTLSQHAANIDAGTPVVIKKKDESASQISIVGVASSTVCTAAAEPTTSDANMYGTFTGTTIKNTDNTNYYFIANNMFYQAGKDTTVPPYRSYFTLSKFNPNSNTWTPSPSFNIVISGNEITGIESATDAQDFFDGIVAVYNISGQRQDDIKPGINIVKYSNGATRKIIVK